MGEVAGQEAQAFASFHRRARQDDALHAAALERIHRAGHGQKGLAGARRANAEGQVVAQYLAQVGDLVGRAALQVGSARVKGGPVRDFVGQGRSLIGRAAALGLQGALLGRQHRGDGELHHLGTDGPRALRVQRFEQFHHLLRYPTRTLDAEVLATPAQRHIEGCLDGAQVFVQRAAQMCKSGVIRRRKAVSQLHGGLY